LSAGGHRHRIRDGPGLRRPPGRTLSSARSPPTPRPRPTSRGRPCRLLPWMPAGEQARRRRQWDGAVRRGGRRARWREEEREESGRRGRGGAARRRVREREREGRTRTMSEYGLLPFVLCSTVACPCSPCAPWAAGPAATGGLLLPLVGLVSSQCSSSTRIRIQSLRPMYSLDSSGWFRRCRSVGRTGEVSSAGSQKKARRSWLLRGAARGGGAEEKDRREVGVGQLCARARCEARASGETH